MKRKLCSCFVFTLFFLNSFFTFAEDSKKVKSSTREAIEEDFYNSFTGAGGEEGPSDLLQLSNESLAMFIAKTTTLSALEGAATCFNDLMDIKGVADDLAKKHYSSAAINTAKVLAGKVLDVTVLEGAGFVATLPYVISFNAIAFTAKKTVESFEAVRKEYRETELLLLFANIEKDKGLEREKLWQATKSKSGSQFLMLREILNTKKNRKYIYEHYIKPVDEFQTPTNIGMVEYARKNGINLLPVESEYKPKGIAHHNAIIKQIGELKKSDPQGFSNLTEKDRIEFDLTPNDKLDDEYLKVKVKPIPTQKEMIDRAYKLYLYKWTPQTEVSRKFLTKKLIVDVNKDIKARKEYYDLITKIKKNKADGNSKKIKAWSHFTDYLLKNSERFLIANDGLIEKYSKFLNAIESGDSLDEFFIVTENELDNEGAVFDKLLICFKQKKLKELSSCISSKCLRKKEILGSIIAGITEIENTKRILLKSISANFTNREVISLQQGDSEMNTFIDQAIKDIRKKWKGY